MCSPLCESPYNFFFNLLCQLKLTENLKTEYDKSKEKEMLQEMLEVVEKREQLICDVENTKKG